MSTKLKQNPDLLRTWKEIANWLKVSIRTAQRMKKAYPSMPVKYYKSTPLSSKQELMHWYYHIKV